jgi:hypothetical protein
MEAARAEQRAAMDAAALLAELRALSDAGSSYDAQAQCCFHLRDALPLPTGAAAEDAVRAVVSALSRGVQHALLQTAGCGALALLLQAAPATIVTAAGVRALLAALRAHPGDADVQGAACAALSALAALDATNRTTAGAAGGVAAVGSVLTQHPADVNVAVHGFSALGNLTLDHPQNAAAALDAGAVPAALAAMRVFPKDTQVQMAGCCVLFRIVSEVSTLGGAHADSAAADAALAAMHVDIGDCRLQLHGCGVLMHIFHDDKNADAAWVRRGGAALTAVTAALRAHAQGVEVLTVGCMALSHLVLSTKDNQRAADISSALEAVVAALRAFPAEAGLQRHGCDALGDTCRHAGRDNQLAAAAAGALEVIISAMRMHTNDTNVQLAGCCALGTLVADVPPSQTRAGALGGVEVMVAAMRTWAVPLPAERADFFQPWCTTTLLLLHEHPINKHKAVTAGVIELLVAHMMCAPAAGADASKFDMAWCTMLRYLVGGTGHEARAVTAGALEALDARRAEASDIETRRLALIRSLQPAAQRHDAAPCAVAGCKRCAAARARGMMCALTGCGARGRDGGAKKLLRCGTCRAACYCSAAHQREDWGRHKGQCGAPPRADDARAAGASGS